MLIKMKSFSLLDQELGEIFLSPLISHAFFFDRVIGAADARSVDDVDRQTAQHDALACVGEQVVDGIGERVELAANGRARCRIDVLIGKVEVCLDVHTHAHEVRLQGGDRCREAPGQ